ncbi:MAG TPA: class I tRNA ligase family protein, partial [Gemmatimonadaceae bacterium]|nr:class I tRNA ligase family protein [Gemmatimonadaceae bacterium]
PHLAEELWEQLGHDASVFDSRWPEFDPSLLVDDEIDLVVQVNGKVRGKIRVPRDITRDAAFAIAMKDESVAKFVQSSPKKVVHVPGRLLSIAV